MGESPPSHFQLPFNPYGLVAFGGEPSEAKTLEGCIAWGYVELQSGLFT